jgi:hypothetical protein
MTARWTFAAMSGGAMDAIVREAGAFVRGVGAAPARCTWIRIHRQECVGAATTRACGKARIAMQSPLDAAGPARRGASRPGKRYSPSPPGRPRFAFFALGAIFDTP